jgi:hypothetical protein
LRHRLIVTAPDAVALVRHAGGWLFDRVMAGWDVTVMVPADVDTRPLRILGVTPIDLESALTSSLRGPFPHELAVDTQLYNSNDRVRDRLREVIEQGIAEIRLWGESSPVDSDGRFGLVQRHQLSVAAKAFKAQALAAASVPVATVPAVETFRATRHLPPSSRGDLDAAHIA